MSVNIDYLINVHLNCAIGYVERINVCAQRLSHLLNAKGRASSAVDICEQLDQIVFLSFQIKSTIWPNIEYRRSRPDFALKKERGITIRSLLKIAEDEFRILRDLDIRNDIVHFDERIDSWYSNSEFRNFARHLVGPRNMIGGSSIKSSDIFQHYIPDEDAYIFAGKEIKMKDLVIACNKIGMRINEKNRFGQW